MSYKNRIRLNFSGCNESAAGLDLRLIEIQIYHLFFTKNIIALYPRNDYFHTLISK